MNTFVHAVLFDDQCARNIVEIASNALPNLIIIVQWVGTSYQKINIYLFVLTYSRCWKKPLFRQHLPEGKSLMWWIYAFLSLSLSSGSTIASARKISDISSDFSSLRRSAYAFISMVPISVRRFLLKILCSSKHSLTCHLDYRDHCHISASETAIDSLLQLFRCSPAVLWFTCIAFLHITWIASLCLTILYQVD